MSSPLSLQTLRRHAVRALLSCLLAVHALAGVTVTQNAGPGATNWPGSPILSTAANPASAFTIAEGFGATATDNYAQTFTIAGTGNYTLRTLCLYVGGGTGTTALNTITLNLYELGGSVAPNPSAYASGVNKFGSGSGLQIEYAPQTNGLLRLDFSGSDQVPLYAGRMYVLEISGIGGADTINWLRNSSDTYSGGAAYKNRAWINGSEARDFGLAVYGTLNTDPIPPSRCTVDATAIRQQIDGFGAGVAFLYDGQDPLNDAQMDNLFGTSGLQFGLTLLRMRIPPDGNYAACVTDGQRAHARGARLLASPWTPPPALKSNNNAIHGSLLPEHYADYVAHLNGFISTMAAAGAPLSVISLQNEPDFDPPDYEGCQWSAEQFRIFCRDFAGDIQAPVMMPESYAFKQPICDATLNDPAAAAHVAYVGGHLYGAVVRDYPLAHSLGKPTWMTEFLINNQTISSAISTAQQIIDCLNVGNMSAYIWWKCIGTANGLLDNASVPQPRGYVMAQFSRFARPGDFRIAITDNTSPLGITAFRDLASARFAIVAVNYGTVPITQEFSITGVTATAVTPWITSATQSLEAQTPLTVTAGTFSYTIPPTSIVTFAGLSTDATAPAKPIVATLTHATSDATPSLAGTAEPRSTVTVYDGATALATTAADAYGKWTLDVALPQGAHTLTTTSTDASGNTSARSGPITLTVGWSRFSALSARAPVGTGDQSLIMGFVYAGGGKPTLVRGVGPGLLNADAGLTAAQILADPRLTLHELQPAGFTEFATNDNWDGSDELRTHMHALGMGALEANSKDAALLVTPARTVCTAQVSGVGNTTGIALAETYDADFQDNTRRLTALSIRNQVGTGNAQLIVGFVIEGNAPKTVLLRGIGPGLVPAVAESAVLANPTLQLNKLDPATGNWTVVGSNDDWGGAPTLATAMRAAGMGELAPGSADAALLLDLAPGIYTAQLTGVENTTGIGLVEIYEAP